MNKTVMFLSGLALGGATLATFSTFAFQGNHGMENQDPVNQDRHEQIEHMFENGDYQSFQQLFDGRGPAGMIDNKDEFNKFVELREARKNGNTEKAESLAKDLGLGQRDSGRIGQRMMGNHGMGRGYGMNGNHGMMGGHGMRGGYEMMGGHGMMGTNGMGGYGMNGNHGMRGNYGMGGGHGMNGNHVY